MQTIGGITRAELSANADYRVTKTTNSDLASRQPRDNSSSENQLVKGQEPRQEISLDTNTLSEEQQKKFEEELKTANESLMDNGKQLRFKYDDEAKSLYVEVLDSKTQEVVVSLPPEFLIDLSKRMKDLIGLFLDKKA